MTRRVIATTAVCLLSSQIAVAVPPGPPPAVPLLDGFTPPAAWIETARGDRWLPPADWLWCPDDRGGLCAPAPAVAMTPAGYCQQQLFGAQPEVVVASGEQVRFHLAFAPDTATVAFGRLVAPLAADRDPAWTVTGATGGLVLQAHIGASTVRYRARLVVGSDATPPRAAVTGAVLRRNGGVFLRLRTSERATVAGCLVSAQPVGGAAGRRMSRRPAMPRATVRAGQTWVPLGRLPNGTYAFRMRVRDATGNSTAVDQRVEVAAGAATLVGWPGLAG